MSQSLLTLCFNHDPLQLLIGLLSFITSIGALSNSVFLFSLQFIYLLKKLGLRFSLASHCVDAADRVLAVLVLHVPHSCCIAYKLVLCLEICSGLIASIYGKHTS